MTDEELYRRGQRAALLLQDDTLKSALDEVKQDQIDVFLNLKGEAEVMEAQSIVAALHLIEKKLNSYVEDKLMIDRKRK